MLAQAILAQDKPFCQTLLFIPSLLTREGCPGDGSRWMFHQVGSKLSAGHVSQDERSQVHIMSVLLCSGMTNRVLIDDEARWMLQGDEQESENRAAGVKALCSMLATTTSGRAKELVKQGLSDRNGMIAFGRIRERFDETAGVAKLSDVFQFQWTSPGSLDDKWLRWQRLMKQVNMTSLGVDTREPLTSAGLEKGQGTCSGTTFASTCSTDLDSVVCKCGSVLTNDGGLGLFLQNCAIDFFHFRPPFWNHFLPHILHLEKHSVFDSL